MIIGIILDTLNEEHKKVEQDRVDEDKQILLDILENNRNLEQKLDRLETLLKNQK